MHTRETAIAELRELLPPGTTVHTILRHVSRSGMTRRISPILMREGKGVFHLDYLVALATERKVAHGGEGITVHGCGMDMGFELVYTLSRVLYPDGYECIGRDADRGLYCPSNDHANGDRDYSPHHHGDGGYALPQRWL